MYLRKALTNLNKAPKGLEERQPMLLSLGTVRKLEMSAEVTQRWKQQVLHQHLPVTKTKYMTKGA